VLIFFPGEPAKRSFRTIAKRGFHLNPSFRLDWVPEPFSEEKNDGKAQKDFVYRYQLESHVHPDPRRGNDKINALFGNYPVPPEKTEF
jgi:hypothetical protein